MGYIFERHPLSSLFPDLPPDELRDLAASIRAEGLRHPILLAGNGDGRAEVLDGWHRYVAARKAGHQFEASDFRRVGGDRNRLIEIVKAENLDRRHLTPSQRAGVLAALYDGKWAIAGDGRPEGADPGNISGIISKSHIRPSLCSPCGRAGDARDRGRGQAARNSPCGITLCGAWKLAIEAVLRAEIRAVNGQERPL